MKEAACVDADPDLFFPEKGQSKSGNEAIKICFNCPVETQCSEYRARTQTEYGIWGGKYTKRMGDK